MVKECKKDLMFLATAQGLKSRAGPTAEFVAIIELSGLAECHLEDLLVLDF